jgi:hypothetical protein
MVQQGVTYIRGKLRNAMLLNMVEPGTKIGFWTRIWERVEGSGESSGRDEGGRNVDT